MTAVRGILSGVSAPSAAPPKAAMHTKTKAIIGGRIFIWMLSLESRIRMVPQVSSS
jgi:hypothetical protein